MRNLACLLPMALLFLLATPVPAAELRLVNGATIPGQLVRDEIKRIVWRAELLGEINVPRSAIATIDGTPLPPPDPARWQSDGKLSVGYDLDLSDDDNEDLDVDTRATWERGKRRHRLEGSIDYEREDSRTTDDEAELSYQSDWLLQDGWYLLTLVEYRRDRDETVQESTGIAPGIGYEFKPLRGLTVQTEAAIGELYSTIDGIGKQHNEAAILRWRGSWKTPWWQLELFHRGEYAWLLDRSDINRLETHSGLSLPLRDRLVGELRFDYQRFGTHPPGEMSQDVEWKMALAWRW